jgi:hypothetical protein
MMPPMGFYFRGWGLGAGDWGLGTGRSKSDSAFPSP